MSDPLAGNAAMECSLQGPFPSGGSYNGSQEGRIVAVEIDARHARASCTIHSIDSA
ncbi:hypothetical protein D3C73_1570630 [compost metagenome]